MKNIMLILITICLAVVVLAVPVHRAHGRTPQVPSAGEFRFQQDAYSVDESAGAVDIVIERISSSDGEVVIDANTFDGTATAGQDYPATAEIVTFADGETEKTISIPIIDNNTAEPDETFRVTLSVISGSGSITEPSSTTITISDDDTTPPGILHFSSESYAALENSVLMTVTVRRSGGAADEVRVSYETSDGSATAGSDYDPALGTLTFADGETVQTFTVTLRDDPGAEGSETFTIELQNVVGVATLGEPSTATVTLLDDETAHRVHLPVVLR